MPIYIARLNDGSCLIGEADSEADARENFQYRWHYSDGAEPEEDLILSIREIPKNIFLSRWWPGAIPDDENLPLGDLEGGITDACDVHEHEYPLIAAAHAEGFRAMAESSDEGPVGPFLENWKNQLNKSLFEAVRTEMQRGRVQSKNV